MLAVSSGVLQCVIIGYNDDGELFIRSSKISRMDALWMAEKAKEWALWGGL